MVCRIILLSNKAPAMRSCVGDSFRLSNCLFIILGASAMAFAQASTCNFPKAKVSCEKGQQCHVIPKGDGTWNAECVTVLPSETTAAQSVGEGKVPVPQKTSSTYSATARYLASSSNLNHVFNCLGDPYLADDGANLRKEEVKWRQKLQEAPNDVRYHYFLAYTLLGLARTPLDNDKLLEAEKEFRFVLQQVPPSVQSFDWSGSALRRLGVDLFEQHRYAEAEDVFKRFIKLSGEYESSGRPSTELSGNPCSLIMLSLTQAAQQNYKDAETNIMRSETRESYTFILLGSVLFDQAKFSDAEDAYRKALKFPDRSFLADRYYDPPLRFTAQEGLVAALLKQEKYADAETSIEQLRSRMNEAWLIFRTGLSQLRQGKYIDAEKSFSEAIALEPYNMIFREALEISKKGSSHDD